MESLLASAKIGHGCLGIPEVVALPPVPVETYDLLLLSLPPLETATMIPTTTMTAMMAISGPSRLAVQGRFPPPLRPCVGSISSPLGPGVRSGDRGLVIREVVRDHLWFVHHLVGHSG